MNGCNTWSYKPYRPLMRDEGKIHICRVVPSENGIHLEWLPSDGEYSVFCRVRDEGKFLLCGTTCDTFFDIKNLEFGKDYEFFVSCGEQKSLVRLARTGETVGETVVNYLHPDDKAFGFSGDFIASPSFVRHPDGHLLTSMDVFGRGTPQNLTMIFRSDDDGKSWRYVCDLFPCFWGKLFIHKGDVYMLSCSTEYGDLLIGRSCDGGNTFSAPVTLFRGSNGKAGNVGVHKNPQPVVNHKGRIWNTLEWGSWDAGYHAPMVMSCDENADLLNPENWAFTPPLPYNPEWEGVAVGPSAGCIEGTLVVAPDGRFLNVMRYDTTRCEPKYGLALAYEVDTENPHRSLRYSHAIDFPGNLAKFSIKFDPVSKRYYSIICRINSIVGFCSRNLLSLMASNDLENWELVTNVYNFKQRPDHPEAGFQYTDFEFSGDDIILVCRVCLNDAPNGHDSNYQVFDRIKDFRTL